MKHYHEFEDWQLDWLLEKTGWKIVTGEELSSSLKNWIQTFTTVLRQRYYIVYAERVRAKIDIIDFDSSNLHYLENKKLGN
jgi:hypothetical protein